MCKNALSKIKSSNNAVRRIMAVLLCAVLLLFVGCEDDKNTSFNSENTDINSSTESAVSDNNAQGTVSDENNSSEAIVDPLTGKFTFDSTVKSPVARDDDGEILPPQNPSDLAYKYVGGADKQAAEMRNKILNTKNTEEYYKITGKKYYISPAGNDENDGLSPEKAIRSTDAIATLNLKAGDAVLFERDSVFRLTQTIRTVEGVIYGSYGTGEKPKIYGSPLNFAKVEWTPSTRKNIWKTSYTYDDTGAMYFNHGEEIGYMKTDVRYLTENTHFYFNPEDCFIYLYCDKGNPSKVYDSIEVSTRISIFTMPRGTGATIDNICMKYAGVIAVNAYFDSHDVVVTNCEMGYIGGCSGGAARYGNAVQCWYGARGLKVTNNWIYQTFDTAVSWQGNGGVDFKYVDIVFENNLTEYNNCDYEFWDDYAELGNFSMSNNIMRFTAKGWGTRTNDGGIRGIEGVYVGDTDLMNWTGRTKIQNNIIDCPDRKVFSWDVGTDKWSKIDFANNKIYWKQAYRTGDEIIRYCKRNPADENNVHTKDKAVIEPALKRFDPTIEIIWLD